MVIEIPLTKGYTAIVDDADKDLASFKWTVQEDGYAIRNKDRRNGRLMHRIILERVIGRPLVKGEICDHADGNKANNTRSNLRVATRRQNSINKGNRRYAKNPYKGVSRSSKYRWKVVIEKQQLGIFSDALEAHRVYCIAALKIYGQWANFGNDSPFIGWSLADLERGWRQLPLPLPEAA